MPALTTTSDIRQTSMQNMIRASKVRPFVEDVQIAGHGQPIWLRSYRPVTSGAIVPVIVYFHGGSFTSGSLDDADIAASSIAHGGPPGVVSGGCSRAPQFS